MTWLSALSVLHTLRLTRPLFRCPALSLVFQLPVCVCVCARAWVFVGVYGSMRASHLILFYMVWYTHTHTHIHTHIHTHAHIVSYHITSYIISHAHTCTIMHTPMHTHTHMSYMHTHEALEHTPQVHTIWTHTWTPNAHSQAHKHAYLPQMHARMNPIFTLACECDYWSTRNASPSLSLGSPSARARAQALYTYTFGAYGTPLFRQPSPSLFRQPFFFWVHRFRFIVFVFFKKGFRFIMCAFLN